ncbi:retinal-specific phospholipid-transporting ATPase ABCA4-like [Homalodisca vitripennis]|uniref:retinal-specific phospholipid-transporting ATPase ABCA4-like n=1 Tax=Homalodisca vitripennis TaxID=197043 RepID=UPI001EEADA78|nr:retinal-specific phospholipid-transporting ATPase ABCA4-like [Homalodisca vitripennis]
MGLCLQLRMLLWKNFLLRKRQKFRLVVELLWPLFLFLILMWVRTKGLRENISECHFTPKALPSVGQVPFIQSFLCSFNNTCHATEKEAQIDGSNLQASRADSLVRELSTMFGQRLVDQDLDAAESVVADLNRLASLVQGITSRQVQVKGVLSVPELVNSTSWIKEEIFRQNISLDENAVDSLITAKFAPQNFSLGHLLLLQENRSLVLCDTQLMTSVIQVQSAVVDQLCRLSAVELDALANIMRESLTAAGTYQQLVQYVESNLDQSLSWSDWNSMRNLSVQVWQDFTSLQNYTKAMSDLAVMSSQYTYLADEMVANNVSRLETGDCHVQLLPVR